jgi:hypothetical protein
MATLGLSCGLAWAQWQWTDANGKRVFSDTAPPASVPEHAIISRPDGRAAVPKTSPPSGEASGSASAPAADPAAAKQLKELEAKRKQAEDAEKAKEKAEQARQARARADNCQRAKTAQMALNSGTPLRTMNAQGERIFMDESARKAELSRVQSIIQQDCGR